MKYSVPACEYCKSHERCRLEDDVGKLLQDIKEADAVFSIAHILFQFTGQFRLMRKQGCNSLIDAGFSPLKPERRQ